MSACINEKSLNALHKNLKAEMDINKLGVDFVQ